MADNHDKLYNGYIQMIKRNELFYENILPSDLKYLLVFCALFRYIELNADKYAFFDKIYAVKNLRLLYGETLNRQDVIDFIIEFEKAEKIENSLLSENFRALTNDIGNDIGMPLDYNTDDPEPESGESNQVAYILCELLGIINDAELEERELFGELRNLFFSESEEMKYLFRKIESLRPSLVKKVLIYDTNLLPSFIRRTSEIAIISKNTARAADEILRIIRGSHVTVKWFESSDEYIKAKSQSGDGEINHYTGYPIAFSGIPDKTYNDKKASYEDIKAMAAERIDLLMQFIDQRGIAYFLIYKDFLSNDAFLELRKALIDNDHIDTIISGSEIALVILCNNYISSKIKMIDNSMSDNAESSDIEVGFPYTETIIRFDSKTFEITKNEISAHDYDLRPESYIEGLVKEKLRIKILTGKLERHYRELDSLIEEFGKLDSK